MGEEMRGNEVDMDGIVWVEDLGKIVPRMLNTSRSPKPQRSGR
jgi:hypothetical protein